MTRIPRKPPQNAQPRITRVDGAITRAKPSEQEMHERRLFVRQLMAAGMYPAEIIEQAISPQPQADGSLQAKFDCGPESIRSIVNEIRNELRREQELFAPTDRAAALQRMYGDLVQLRGELGLMRSLPRRDFVAIRNHTVEVRATEKLIAELEGTLRGPKVDVVHGMSDALARALGGMTPEQQEEAIRQEMQLARDATSVPTTAEDSPHGHHPEAPQASPAPHGRRGPALPAPGFAHRVGRPPSQGSADPAAAPPVPAGRKVRSSDLAARRQGGASTDADVEGRLGPGVSGTRVVG